MKPAPFTYEAPETLDEALKLLSAHEDAKVLAGGQSLIPLLNMRLSRPPVVVDIDRIGGLSTVEVGERVRLGALVRHRTLELDPDLASACPLLGQAAAHIGHSAIRTRGTLGGSLAHADPSAELPMVALLLDAELELASESGRRTVPASEFFFGFMTTALQGDELIVAVELPKAPPRSGSAVEEFAERGGDFALVAAAAQVSLDGHGRVETARVALCGVGPGPVRAGSVEEAARGAASAADFAGAAQEVLSDIDPEDDLHASADYRRDLSKVLTRRALERAFKNAQEKGEAK